MLHHLLLQLFLLLLLLAMPAGCSLQAQLLLQLFLLLLLLLAMLAGCSLRDEAAAGVPGLCSMHPQSGHILRHPLLLLLPLPSRLPLPLQWL